MCHFIITKQREPSLQWIHLEDLDLNDNQGINYDEKVMLEDLIKNGSKIDYCKFNREGHIVHISMQFGERFSDFVLFPKLSHLGISYNSPVSVEFIKTHSKSINWLGLDGENLIKIPDLSSLINLNKLYLNNNNIEFISGLSDLMNLRELYLNNNNIEQINGCGDLPELSVLNLANNQIKSLKGLEEFAGCPKLSEINLSENQIFDLCEFEPVSHLHNLEKINLKTNKITEVNITHDVPKLGGLSLNNNQIEKIVAIKNLSGLSWIDIRNNQLAKLENMSNLPKLSSIHADDNPISSFSGMENLPKLETISWIEANFESEQEIERYKRYFKNLGLKFYWTSTGLLIDKIRFPTLTYRISEHLSLKLKRDKSDGENPRFVIYVDDKPFLSCMCLLFTIEKDKIHNLDNISSIDELDENDERDADYYISVDEIPAEERFWAHRSNIQAWVVHNYDTRLLHRNLAFPLLKKLTEAGDLTAKKVFKEEIAKRYSSGHPSVQEYLKEEGYLNFLSEEELAILGSQKENSLTLKR